MEVRRPFKWKGPYPKSLWHRSYHAEAKTGDWYKYLFVANDKGDSLIRPWDGAGSNFYMKQHEGKLFGGKFVQKKWLEYNHSGCTVKVKTNKKGKKPKEREYDLMPGARGTLGIVYWMRNLNFKLGETQRTLENRSAGFPQAPTPNHS